MKMPFADFHCDTLTCLSKQNKDMFFSGLQCDLRFSKNFEDFVAVFAIFIPENLAKSEAKSYYSENVGYLYRQLDKFSENLLLVKTAADLKVRDKHKIVLSIENFSFADENEVEKAYNDGVRIASLTWNADNEFAGGAYSEGELSEKGEKIIRAMESKGMILDLSHLNGKSTDMALNRAKKPVIATHSSSFLLCKDLRNLTDQRYLKIAENGGIVGVNFYRDFVGGNKTADDIVDHIEHFYKLCKNAVVFGSDFDGAEMPDGITGLSDMNIIFEKMEKRGIPPQKLYENAVSFLQKFL